MEEHVYTTTGGYEITIRASKSEHKLRRERGPHQSEGTRTHYRQHHHGSYSQNPASGKHSQSQGYPKLTAENLAAHQRQERGDHAPQVYRKQEDDTAAQCGQRYPEGHRRRRQHFEDTAHAQHNQHTRRAAHDGRRQESGPYEAGSGRATEGGRSGGEYVNQSYAQPYVQPRYEGEEYQHQHTYDPAYHQQDRQELGQERFGYSYSYREEDSPRRRRASSSQAPDVAEWVLCRKGLRNVEEKSEEGSIQCEIEEAE